VNLDPRPDKFPFRGLIHYFSDEYPRPFQTGECPLPLNFIGELKKTTTATATATATSLNKRFNEENNGCARAL